MTAGSGIFYQQMEVGPLIGSGVLVYTIPKSSVRVQPGGIAHPAKTGSLSTYATQDHPNTKKTIDGFYWDKRTWYSEETDNSFNTIPQNWDPTTSGIPLSYFQSGIGSHEDVKLLDISHVPSSGTNQLGFGNPWAPILNHGYYYDFSEQGYLFSDDSEIVYPEYSGIVLGLGSLSVLPSGFSKISLFGSSKPGIPIRAYGLEWNNDLGEYSIFIEPRKRIHFTGKRDLQNIRLSTFDSIRENILWENIDTTFDEFVIVNSGVLPEAIFNKNYIEAIGSTTSLPLNLETLGISDGESTQQYHTKYSPIDSSMGIDIYSYVITSGTITQWMPIPLDEVIASGENKARIDYDLGIIHFGNNLPDSSIPAIPLGHTVAAKYYKTLHLEYEPIISDNIIVATETNLNPIYRKNGVGFVYLKTKSSDPQSITLKADFAQLSLSESLGLRYGPLYIGNSFAPAVATVKDGQGEVLEDQPISFFITSLPAIGSFGAIRETVTAISDEFGEARAFYTPPRSIFDIGENVTASNFTYHSNPIGSGILPNTPEFSGIVSQAITLRTQNLLIEGNREDIYLYQVRVDDATLGLLDLDVDQTLEEQVKEYYRKFFIDEQTYGPTGLTTVSGLYLGPNGFTSAEWETDRRLTWDLLRPKIFEGRAFEGRKVLVAQYESDVLNPHTLESGAYYPTTPIQINKINDSQFDLTYDTTIYNIPRPTVTDTIPSGIIHSYFVVSPSTVRIQASVYNQRLNQDILSNEIELQLAIPPYLNGVWIIDAINSNHISEISDKLSTMVANNQRVPLGFRLRSSTITLAAALDGVTFLDINQPFNRDIYDLDTVSGVRLGHQLNVEI